MISFVEKYLYDDLYQLETSHWWHLSKRNVVLTLLNKFKLKKELKILDVGCGTGQNIVALTQLGQCWGVDNNKEALRFCQKRGLVHVSSGDCQKLPYTNNHFDVVTLLDVLEHTDDYSSLKEVSRVLKPHGLVIITVPAIQGLWSRWDEVLHHQRRYNKRGLERLLIKNGFIILKISYLYSFLVLPLLLVRFIKSLFFKDYYPSDFKLSSSLINRIMYKISQLESSIMLNIPIPLGTSLVCVASKK